MNHLDKLENNSIYLIREAYNQFKELTLLSLDILEKEKFVFPKEIQERMKELRGPNFNNREKIKELLNYSH